MTEYLWFCVGGAILGALVAIAGDEENWRTRLTVGGGLCAAALFIYGLVVSVADVVSR